MIYLSKIMVLLSSRLEAFVSIQKQGSVQSAARELGLTQTAVTQRLRVLEQELGASLFTRSRKGMRLTSEGVALLRYCDSALDLEGEALASIQGAGKERLVRMRIAGPSSILRARTIPQAIRVSKKWPKVRLNFDLRDIDSMAGILKRAEANIVVLRREDVSNEMDSKLLRPERYVLVGPRSWSKRKLEAILNEEAIVDFDESDQMTFDFLRKYRLHRFELGDRHFVNNTDALASSIEAGLGYSVISEDFARPLLKQKKIINIAPEKFLDFQVALAWYPRDEIPDYFKDFVSGLS